MPSVSFPTGPDDVPYIDEPDFSDLMFKPQKPQHDEQPELTTQERHQSGFAGEGFQGPKLGGFQHPGNENETVQTPWSRREGHKPLYKLQQQEQPVAQRLGEVCILKQIHPDKPARAHVVVGKHCPHGLRERMEADEARRRVEAARAQAVGPDGGPPYLPQPQGPGR